MRYLIVAWVTTLSLIGAGVIWAEMTYIPPPPPPPQETPDFDADGNPNREEVDNDQNEINLSQPAEDNATQSIDSTPIQNQAELDTPATDGTPANTSTPPVVDETGFQNNFIIAAGDPELTEQSPYGNIPIIWNQRQPWQVYARPFEKPGDRPRISIVISNVGLDTRKTQSAIDDLPPEITFAISPYAQGIENWTEDIRRAGHEMLLMVPMEPLEYPLHDPGPRALMTNLSENENLDRLWWILSRFNGYVGIINEMGSKFTADPEAIRHIMQDVQRRGLAYIDARTSSFTLGATSAREFGIPTATNTLYIDNELSAAQIDRYLRELETTAQRSGVAIGIGRTNPVTFRRIIEWAQTLDAKGIDLAPITAVINKQDTQ